MMSTLIDSPTRLLIDGSWRDAESEAVLEVFEPATGERMATVARASPGDVDRAVEAARRAFDHARWRGVAASARGRVLAGIAAGIRHRVEALASLAAPHPGQPLPDARHEVL